MGGEPDASALAVIVGSLESNPILAMSLGSRELFHSNLLAWFISRHPPVARALGLPAEVTVLREKNHTDLLIEQGHHRLMLIENKVFALPDVRQLARLADRPDFYVGELLLLSLTSPGWPDGAWTSPGGNRWTWLSYGRLSGRLQPVLPAVAAADQYAGATLERWLEHFARLEDLVLAVGRPSPDEPVILATAQRAVLRAARLDGPVQKMRYEQVAAGLAARGVNATVGMTRGTGLIDWFTDGPDGLIWGWQLQGDQFRLTIIVPQRHPGHGRDLESRAAREEESAHHPAFFDFGALPAPYTATASAFRHFAPDSVYRYVHVPGITVGQAVKLGYEHSLRISQAGT
jgi:hypothetical protein